mgnify:CR=1 FL=1
MPVVTLSHGLQTAPHVRIAPRRSGLWRRTLWRRILHAGIFGVALWSGLLLLNRPAAGFEPEPGTFEPGPTRFRTPTPRTAPDPRQVVRECKEKLFVDCFRLWQPLEVPEPLETPKPPKPPTPPRPPQRQAAPTPPDPNAPKPPDRDDDDEDLTHPDQATYDALRDALGQAGLADTVKIGPLTPGPLEGRTDLTVTTPKPAPPPGKGPRRRTGAENLAPFPQRNNRPDSPPKKPPSPLPRPTPATSPPTSAPGKPRPNKTGSTTK